MPTQNPAGLTLNGVIITYDVGATIRVGTQPYVDEDRLHRLRDENRLTHVFRRDRDRIIDVPVAAKTAPIGTPSVRVLREAAPLVSALAMDALLRYFSELGRQIWNYKPLRILSSKGADQLLRSALSNGSRVPTWLEQRVSYLFDTRLVFPEDAPPAVLLACDVKTCNIISAPCSELLERGIPLEGRYVQVRGTIADARLSPKPRLIGRVTSRHGDRLTLDDNEEGYSTVRASDAFLEPRHENLEWCIGHLIPQQAASVRARLASLGAAVNGGPERLGRVTSMLDHLRGVALELSPGIPFTVGPLLKSGHKAHWFPKRETISKPALLFSPLPGRTDHWNERGIDRWGPYDRSSFTPRRPRIAIICQAQAQGRVEQFVRKFLDGLPEVKIGKPPRAPYERGFVRRFELEGVETSIFPTANETAAAYRESCNRAIARAADTDFRWDLALVQIDDAFHQLDGDNNPYLVTKAAFMKQHVPVQEVTLEKMAAASADLVYILNDISLAAYAKMGGTPWLLSAQAPVAHELVIGLGSHYAAGSRIGSKERVVGITTVFSGDGRYLLESRSTAVPYADYPDAIKETLERAIRAVRVEQNWLPNDNVRLVFHAFKRFRNAEVDAVKHVVTAQGLPHAQFAFLHVVDDHPFLAFDPDNLGAYAVGGARKGVFAPERGTALKLNREDVLLMLTGAREVKQASDGLPKPVLLQLHPGSTFKDVTYLARQVFAFSCHSWRGFAPARLPITILYSELIARMLRNLSAVSTWDPDALLGPIGRMRWFL